MRQKILNLLSLIFLSKEARDLGKSFRDAGVTGAHVTSRGTLVCSALQIQQSNEFKSLVAEHRNHSNARNQRPQL